MLGLTRAGHAEDGVAPEQALITPAACEVPAAPGAPRMSGTQRVVLRTGTLASRLYGGAEEAFESFYCSYELNARYQPLFERSAMCISGVGDRGEARIVELDSAPFFLATLFLPQLAAVNDAHPVVDGFVQAVAATAT